jgi:HAD superfamily hydrolase (TIGR01509 family)
VLVIFDCDGVLVDSESLVNRIEAAYFTQCGVAMDEERARRLFKGKTVGEAASFLEQQIGHDLSPVFAYDWAMTTAIGLATELRAIPGVEPLIEELRAHGVPICVASQSPLPRVILSLRVTGLSSYFDGCIFTASMVERPKPAPDLFLHAAARMGCEPAHAVVIEDSPSGVVAARAAGMRVFGYAAEEDPDALRDAGAEVFTSMDDLRLRLGFVENFS